MNHFGNEPIRAKHHSSTRKTKSVNSSRHFAVFDWRGFGENEVESTGRAKISRLEALAVGKACYARHYSYSRFKKRELLISLGSHQGVLKLLRPQYPSAGSRIAIVWHGNTAFKNAILVFSNQLENETTPQCSSGPRIVL